jgi:hypothetical protein
MAMSVYDDLCTFALAHRPCGEIRVQVDPGVGRRYRALLMCSCGALLRRAVTQEDAREDLASAEGRMRHTTRRYRPGYGSAGSAPGRSMTA